MAVIMPIHIPRLLHDAHAKMLVGYGVGLGLLFGYNLEVMCTKGVSKRKSRTSFASLGAGDDF